MIDISTVQSWIDTAEKAVGLITSIITLAKAIRAIARKRKGTKRRHRAAPRRE